MSRKRKKRKPLRRKRDTVNGTVFAVGRKGRDYYFEYPDGTSVCLAELLVAMDKLAERLDEK